MLHFLPLFAALALPGDPPPNIVLILADDLGVDLVRGYGEASQAPCTPTLDGLIDEGLLFRNAWANPVCSPTRAAVLTGRHGFRTGIGNVVMPGDAGLSLDEVTMPEMLSGYASAAIGKWHLAGAQSDLHPNDSGFDHFAGVLGGGVADYFHWTKTVDGSSTTSTTYVTTDTVDEAIASMSSMPEPWFLYVAFVAPHTPTHEPPPGLCPSTGCAPFLCANPPANASDALLTKAMTTAMDTELGRLLAALDTVDPEAYVFFLGDNGTAGQASQPPFVPAHAKGTLYEGGVNVPLIVRGPGVPHAESAALVACTDLFATFAELAGVPSSAEDSVSLVPCFSAPAGSPRDVVYAETFPNGAAFPALMHDYALRDERYKLKRVAGQADELFDLLADPFETANLLPNLTEAEQGVRDRLEAELLALHTGDSLAVFPAEVSVTTGGSQALALDAGPAHAGELHLVVGSLSGTSPGLDLGPVLLPLNYDFYMQFTLVNPNTSVFENTFGVLDGLGTTNAAIHFTNPLDPAFVGLAFHHAFLVFGAAGTFEFASGAAALTLGA